MSRERINGKCVWKDDMCWRVNCIIIHFFGDPQPSVCFPSQYSHLKKTNKKQNKSPGNVPSQNENITVEHLSPLGAFKITVSLNPSSQTTEIFPWKCAVTHAPLCFSITVIQHRQHCTCSLQYQRTVPVRVVVIHHLHYLIQNNRHFNIKQIVMRSLGEFLQLIKQEGIKWLQK